MGSFFPAALGAPLALLVNSEFIFVTIKVMGGALPKTTPSLLYYQMEGAHEQES